MTTILDIPIKLHFVKIPVAWEVRTMLDARGRTVTRLCGKPIEIQPNQASVSELDGWHCRKEFLNLPNGDVEALRAFLGKVGIWNFDAGSLDDSGSPMMLELDRVWRFQEDIGDALLDRYRKNFMAQVTPQLPVPETWLELVARPYSANDFRLRFELTKIAAGAVTVTNAFHMLLATIFIDIARGIRFKVCERKDCNKQRIFPLVTEHKKKYCSWYCGHIESVRRKRREKRKARKSLR